MGLRPRKITPKNFSLKVCIRDYVVEATRHANFSSNRYRGTSPHIGKVLPLCDFFDCSVLFFSGTTQFSRSIAQTTCFRLFGVRTMGDVVWEIYPKNCQNGLE